MTLLPFEPHWTSVQSLSPGIQLRQKIVILLKKALVDLPAAQSSKGLPSVLSEIMTTYQEMAPQLSPQDRLQLEERLLKAMASQMQPISIRVVGRN